jgi:asparagine synthetase B (glutamine-hydrolysing)
MQGFFVSAGTTPAIFRNKLTVFREKLNINPEEHSVQAFHVGVFNDTDYYPLGPVFHNRQRGITAVLRGYVWHDDATAHDLAALEREVWNLCEHVINKNFVPSAGLSGIYNLLVFDEKKNKLFITADSSGLLPVYYSSNSNGLFLSSHIRLLAHTLGASIDDVGLLEASTLLYSIGERTSYENINCLLPGRSLIYDIEKKSLEHTDHQEYFQQVSDANNASLLAEQVWQTLVQACERVGRGKTPIGIMLSGGLDSRMVIAGLQAASVPSMTCTHGQKGFHEVQVSQQIADLSGYKHHFVDLDEENYVGSVEEIEEIFWRNDLTIFPLWRLGGRLLKEQGAHAVTTGYALDATLGGHFHDPVDKKERFRRRMQYALQGPPASVRATLNSESYLQSYFASQKARIEGILKSQKKFWCKDYYTHLTEILPRCIDDMTQDVERIRGSGTKIPSKIVERYVCENYARKVPFNQEMTAGAYLPVVLPTYDRDFVRLLSQIDSSFLADHYLYFKVMRKYARPYARIPYSATALPVTTPTLILEVARLVRNRYDNRISRQSIQAKGGSVPNRFGAYEFETVIRKHGALDSLEGILCKGSSTRLDGSAFQTDLNRIRNYQQKGFNLVQYTSMVPIKLAEKMVSEGEPGQDIQDIADAPSAAPATASTDQ